MYFSTHRNLVKFLSMRKILSCIVVALAFTACNSSKVIFRESYSNNEKLVIKSVNYSHCGCSHVYAEKSNNNRKVFFIAYTDKGATKSIYRYNSSGEVLDTIILKGVNTNDYTIPLDSSDIIIFNKIDSFAQKPPSAPIYKIRRPMVKGYVRN